MISSCYAQTSSMQEAPSPIHATLLTLENLNRLWIHGTSRINKSWQSRLNIARMWVKGSTGDMSKLGAISYFSHSNP